MRRHYLIAITGPILLILGIVGCQPGVPLDLSTRYMVNSSFQRTNSTNTNSTDYSQLFKQNQNQQTTQTGTSTQPPAASAACQSTTQKVQNLINRCKSEIDYNYDDIQQNAPNCLTAFYNLSPSNCSTLNSQITNVRNSCGLIASYASYFPNCYPVFSSF